MAGALRAGLRVPRRVGQRTRRGTAQFYGVRGWSRIARGGSVGLVQVDVGKHLRLVRLRGAVGVAGQARILSGVGARALAKLWMLFRSVLSLAVGLPFGGGAANQFNVTGAFPECFVLCAGAHAGTSVVGEAETPRER